MKKIIYSGLLAVLLSLSSPVFACSSCGCTLSPEWIAQGYTPRPGMKLDLRYDFLNQTQLRRGAHAVSRSAVPLPNAEEIQGVTRTSMYTLGLDYTDARDWGLRFEAPFLDRYHTTVPPGETTESSSDTKALGDIKITGRYYGFGDRMTGIQFGVKLPTGSFGQDFRSGTEAGEPLDRGLQAGTGTTDVIFGVYNLGYLGKHFNRFTQALVKTPLAPRDHFRPGASVHINAGIQYLGLPKVTPQFQLNAKIEGRDKGAEADTPNSGSTVVYASPGLTLKIAPRTQVYGFVQAPLHQEYNGLQLAPRVTASAGLVYSF
ncbi:MAG: hypothetical protein EPN97_12080 [Alphaproteobacteria bacterium]|nr:MAG: hypothetical protein EPN97_12080 [Alphaproteobacteria bacterium]